MNLTQNISLFDQIGNRPIQGHGHDHAHETDWTTPKTFGSGLQAVYLIGCTIGIIGNSIVIATIAKCKEFKGKPSYWLIANLAVTDCLTSTLAIIYYGVHMKIQLRPSTPQLLGEIVCRFIDSELMFWVSAQATVNTIITIAFDRYFAIVYPLNYEQWFGKQKSKIWITLTWVSTVFNVYWVPMFNTYDGKGACILHLPAPKIYSHLWGILMYHIPVPTVIYLYAKAYRRLRQNCRQTKCRAVDSFRAAASRRLLKLMTVIFIGFVACYTLQCNGYLLWSLNLWDGFFNNNVQPITLFVMLANSWINPLVYGVSSKIFQDSVRNLFSRRTRAQTRFRSSENALDSSPKGRRLLGNTKQRNETSHTVETGTATNQSECSEHRRTTREKIVLVTEIETTV